MRAEVWMAAMGGGAAAAGRQSGRRRRRSGSEVRDGAEWGGECKREGVCQSTRRWLSE